MALVTLALLAVACFVFSGWLFANKEGLAWIVVVVWGLLFLVLFQATTVATARGDPIEYKPEKLKVGHTYEVVVRSEKHTLLRDVGRNEVRYYSVAVGLPQLFIVDAEGKFVVLSRQPTPAAQ